MCRSDQGEAVCMVAPQPPLATYPTLGQGGQFALSAAPLTNFQYPISPSWMQPVILQPSVSPNQVSLFVTFRPIRAAVAEPKEELA